MLGRTEPAESKKHGVSICSAGYSRELGQFMRLYPLPYPNQIQKWSRCQIPLRRPRDDNRLESWRIDVTSESAGDAIRAVKIIGLVRKDTEFEWLKSHAAPSINALNQQRRSLGIIIPQGLSWSFERRKDIDPEEQMVLFDRRIPNSPVHQSDLIPRVHFLDEAGKHSLTLKEWGCGEWLRKHRGDADLLWRNLMFHDQNREHLLFIGNQNGQRTSWLIIATISRVKSRIPDMFSDAA